MTAVRALILALALLLLPRAAAQAADPRLVPDASSRAIDITYRSTGAELLPFGANLYPGPPLTAARADLVVVRKWPVRPMQVRDNHRVPGRSANSGLRTERV